MRAGFLWPADGLNEAEYLTYLPKGLDWHVLRYWAGTDSEELTADVLSAYAQPDVISKAARRLRPIAPNVIACGDHAACIMAGLDGELAISKAVSDVAKVPCITVGNAIRTALDHLGKHRIAVFSPYQTEITSRLISSLERQGKTVVSEASANACSEEEIGPRPANHWWQTLVNLVNKPSQHPEALLIAGGGLCFAQLIEQFEAETRIPIITAPGALVWTTGRSQGIDTTKPKLGLLFREKSSGSINRIAKRQSTGTKSFSVTSKPPVFRSGAGVFLIDEAGVPYLDFASGSGTSALGHDHPAIKAAISEQLSSGITHLGPHFHSTTQADLYDQLTSLLPTKLNRLHPAVSGGEATEVALKATMHATGKNKFLGFTGGYHGRTFGALSVSGARGKNKSLKPFCPATQILPFPDSLEKGRAAAAVITNELAGVIIEPIQATAGLRKADKKGLCMLADAARENNVPLIFDEVFTGFGRTGLLFAFEGYQLVPDMLILGKALGGGLPAGMVVGDESILGSLPLGVQTSTFQLHPTSAATASAFLKTFIEEDILNHIRYIENWCCKEFQNLEDEPGVISVRGSGAFWVLEMDSPENCKKTRKTALEAGLLTWECGETGTAIGLVPPYIVGAHHIQKAKQILVKALRASELVA